MKELSYDIVIVGGGSAGVAAAIGASQNGRSVLLIEKTNQLGGQATNAEVGTICGLFLNTKEEEFDYNVSSFAQEFAQEIQRKSNSTPVQNSSGLKFLPYSIEEFNNHCIAVLEKNKVSYLLDSEMINASSANREITSLEIATKGKRIKVNVKSVVDATGVSCVSELLGEELIEPSFQQTVTQIFTISNNHFSSEQNLNLVLIMKLRYNKNFDLSVVPGSYSENKVALKLNFKKKLSVEDTNKQVNSAFLFLTENLEGFKDAKLHSIAPQLGERIGKRPIGKYVLTEEDVLSCRKFKDSVANGNWPIEQWDAEQGVIIKPLQENDYYQIPKGCLESKNYTNLFFAGRNISATDEAIASARVIGTCLQTGFAAGLLS